MRVLKPLLVLSLTLNLGLSLVLTRSESAFRVVNGVSDNLESRASGSERLGGFDGYESYYEALIGSGWSHQDTKPILLALLEMGARRAAAVPGGPYWQLGELSQPDRALRLIAEIDKARSVLTQIYGADANRDPVFSSIFRPLGPAFSFLSSDRQVKVQKLKLQQQVSAVMATPSPLPIAPPQQPIRVSQFAPNSSRFSAEFESKLADLLDAEALFEYRLRDSTLAEQLRRSEVEFSESEFRETFRILDRLEKSGGDQALYGESRDSLRNLLGGRRFALLWSGRDPLFAVIQRSCEEHSLTQETTSTVYELFNDNQDRLLKITQGARSDPERGAREVREENAELRRRLSGLVGDDVADDILRSTTRYVIALMKDQPLVSK